MTTSSSTRRSFRVGLIQGSQRVVRAGPQIADFVLDIIKSSQSSTSAAGPNIDLELVDTATLGLPLFDEPGVPSQIHDPSKYKHEHTRAWSARVAALDGFVIVSPQYNWGIPAGLKNAIDYLYNEWKDKPVAVVTYGGHGGDKCAAALGVVLGGGLRMRLIQPPICLAFPDRPFTVTAALGQQLNLDANCAEGIWADKRVEILAVWEKLLNELES